ncbi:MAG: topoisomerase IV [Clostridia bacterium]|nr:topoisomerase IV [Clostridia bacterium]
MARKKKEEIKEQLPPAPATPQPITETIEKNYMPYAMSVIISRAIPEIDGFKPAHRKLLFTMYKMGLLKGNRTKSANVVGATMQYNPHGDMSIYETMVRLTKDNEALLHPLVDSKGSFGKQYSSDMAFAASRYTEVKLAEICQELFSGIDKDAVDMIDNYDSTKKEPRLLPTTFPNVLVCPNEGIAVGMASKICSFNLSEVCDGAIQLLRNPSTTVDQLLDIIKAPDFPGGASIIYNREKMREIYETGHGGFKMRAKWQYDKKNNCIEILEIPYCTTIEQIIKAVADIVNDKNGKLKEISDMRDEIGLHGFKLAIDLKKGSDPELVMNKLYKLTPLESQFSCNFNVLIDSSPMVLGVKQILEEWIKFRVGCVRRELTFDLNKKQEKLHLLMGLGKILLDIDKAIRIVRETKLEKDVVPNLMEGFGVDKVQAEYIAEIKLRHLNREYIMNRIKEIEDLQKEIAELEALIASEKATKNYIAGQLREIKKKYHQDRRTDLIYDDEIEEFELKEEVEDINYRIVLTREGYFKKITMASLKGSDVQKVKDGDEIVYNADANSQNELIFFTDKANAYKAKVADFDNCKASEFGKFIPVELGFDEGEKVFSMVVVTEYDPNHNMIFIFENGKGVRVPLNSYQTKNNRRKLVGAFSDASPIIAAIKETEPVDVMLISNINKAIIVNSELISLKTTRNAQGITLYTLRKNQRIVEAITDQASRYANLKKYKKTKIPATGTALEELDVEAQQISLI